MHGPPQSLGKWHAINGQGVRTPTIALLFAAIFCAGCESTEDELKTAHLQILDKSLIASRSILDQLKTKSLPPATHDVHFFFDYNVINQIFDAITPYTFPLPSNAKVTVSILSITIHNIGALPTVHLKATARREALTVPVEATGLVTLVKNRQTGLLTIGLQVQSFIPKLTWYWFELSKGDLVKTILESEVEQISEKLPVLQLPLAHEVQWGASASTQHMTIRTSDPVSQTEGSTLEMKIRYPSTETRKLVTVTDSVFLLSGIHLFTVLK
ncbi:hypothetical protein YTPLAS18_33080 [Nitrospira sp.]|nr:hypothetical protein YTPLAS18_33080 [Nitrospira sp.]